MTSQQPDQPHTPPASAGPLATTDLSPEAALSFLAGKRMIIIDDSFVSGTLMSILCKNAGAHPFDILVTAGHTIDGIVAQVKEHAPDGDLLIVSDYDMPGMTGVEVCEAIRRAFGTLLPVVIVSANDYSSAGAAAGMAFLKRPADIEHVAVELLRQSERTGS